MRVCQRSEIVREVYRSWDSVGRFIKNVAVTRRVSEAENLMRTGPRLRVGLLFAITEGPFFMGRTMRVVAHQFTLEWLARL